MKNSTLLFIFSLLCIYNSLYAQENDGDPVREIFAERNDTDFWLTMQDGTKQYFTYYIGNDTLFNVGFGEFDTKIYIQDIDFAQCTVKAVDTVFYNGNVAYSLNIVPKQGKFITFFGMEGITADLLLLLPDKNIADGTLEYLMELAGEQAIPVVHNTSPQDPKEICQATGDLSNDLLKNNLETYRSENLLGDYYGFKSYASKINFPGAINTTIAANELSVYRSANIELANEILESDTPGSSIMEKYNYIVSVYSACLVQNGFTKSVSNAGLYKEETNFTMSLNTGGMFSSLQEGNTLKITVRINQNKVQAGYQNSLEIIIGMI